MRKKPKRLRRMILVMRMILEELIGISLEIKKNPLLWKMMLLLPLRFK